MTLSPDADRFTGEGDRRVDQATRDDSERMLRELGELRERFLLEASAFAAGVKALSPHLIERWEGATRAQTMSHEEALAGFIECVSDNVKDLIDHDELRRLTAIVETGEDE